MAKGNVLLGQMRGKVGDVLFKHVGGQQITSAVNHPSNPKTERQQYQRAIMATVTRAYAAGSRIFDHSFQGLQTGAQNQAKFFRENCKILRNLMVDEVNAPAQQGIGHLGARARCVSPGSFSPVGFDGMLISDGTLPNDLWEIHYADPLSERITQLAWTLPYWPHGQSSADYCKQWGIIADDYYTLVGFICTNNEPDAVYPVDELETMSFNGYFFTLRMHTKASFVYGSYDAWDSKQRDLWEIDEFFDASSFLQVDRWLDERWIGILRLLDLVTFSPLLYENGGAWMGMIRSHKNDKFRSKSYLYRCLGDERCGLTPNRVKEFWYNTPVTPINNPE